MNHTTLKLPTSLKLRWTGRMTGKLILLLLVGASAQVQGMEQFKKLRTDILKKYYKVDHLWRTAFAVAERIDGYKRYENKHKEDKQVWHAHTNVVHYTLGPIEKTLSRVYGKEIRFSGCGYRTEYQGTCHDVINKFYEEFEKDRKE